MSLHPFKKSSEEIEENPATLVEPSRTYPDISERASEGMAVAGPQASTDQIVADRTVIYPSSGSTQPLGAGLDSANTQFGKKSLLGWLRRHPVRAVIAGFCVLLLSTWVVFGWFIISTNRNAAKQAIRAGDSKVEATPVAKPAFDSDTLFIDSKSHTVGVQTTTPDGLQVQSSVSDKPRGKANVRLGVDSGTTPAVILEDAGAKQWRADNVDGVLRLSQPGVGVQAQLTSSGFALEHDLEVKGSTILGAGAGDTTTIRGTNLAIPNNLNIGNKALYIGNNGQVGVGTNNTAGYKLFVAGTLKVAGSAEAASFNSASDSAKNPGFTWIGNNNTGIFHADTNAVGISAGGSEVLRVQPGLVAALGGANIEAEGYLRSGREASNPAWRIQRYTGSLDAAGAAVFGHGVTSGQIRIISVSAFYKGNSGEAQSLSVDMVDGSNVQLSGGIPGRPWRAMVIYTADSLAW